MELWKILLMGNIVPNVCFYENSDVDGQGSPKLSLYIKSNVCLSTGTIDKTNWMNKVVPKLVLLCGNEAMWMDKVVPNF